MNVIMFIQRYQSGGPKINMDIAKEEIEIMQL